jgi:hypothetical protein
MLVSQKITTFRLKPSFRFTTIGRETLKHLKYLATFFNRLHYCVPQVITTKHTILTILTDGAEETKPAHAEEDETSAACNGTHNTLFIALCSVQIQNYNTSNTSQIAAGEGAGEAGEGGDGDAGAGAAGAVAAAGAVPVADAGAAGAAAVAGANAGAAGAAGFGGIYLSR